jgi:hypothetical protein
MRVVISQSMLFPWVGLLEQVRLADVFVHYDDVQFSKGSFVNRVQIKTPTDVRWMTVKLRGHHMGQAIGEVSIAPMAEWRAQHLELLRKSFEDAPFGRDALGLAEGVYATEHPSLGALARASLMALIRYFGLDVETRFVDIRELGVPGQGYSRVLAVVQKLGGSVYITGHGAAHYLDHALFEKEGVSVEYMNYLRLPYPQRHGPFTPFVSALDLIANCGRDGIAYIRSNTIHWRKFIHEPA